MPFLEHPENISLALNVCQECGIAKKIALEGMRKTTPDPGALFIWDLKEFIWLVVIILFLQLFIVIFMNMERQTKKNFKIFTQKNF